MVIQYYILCKFLLNIARYFRILLNRNVLYLNKVKQSGFAHLVLLLLLLIIIGLAGGFYYFTNIKNPGITPKSDITVAASESAKIMETPVPAPSNPPAPIVLRKTYTDANFKFSFVYPAVLNVQPDSEDDYSKRNGGNARENFTGYVKYEPGKVLMALSVLGKDTTADSATFTIWIFDNPNQFSPEQWFNKYWYYPYLWGVFNYVDKKPLEPANTASISGQVAKFAAVAYQQDSPKYYYIAKEGKMFLIRVLTSGSHTGDGILETFNFTN